MAQLQLDIQKQEASLIYYLRSNCQESMKKILKCTLRKTETYLDTDVEDSHVNFPTSSSIARRIKNKKSKVSRQVTNQPAQQIKLYRFQLKKAKKTIRIPCFEEEKLNLPVRFTRKVAPMDADNDAETDQEMADQQVQRCHQWLVEAIQENSTN